MILGGHITVQVDGPVCTCGNRGCLEALIGTAALKKGLRARSNGNIRTTVARFSAR